MKTHCIYCGHLLVIRGHWGICPVCPQGKNYLASTTINVAKLLTTYVGGLLRERGKPTIGGERK